MGSLKQYSGLTTKIKAMRSRLISKEEYEKIADCSTVTEVAEYLKDRDGYMMVLRDADFDNIHRETVEHAVAYSVYNDFNKIYKFASLEQRKYLKLHFVKYEVDMIKKSMRKSSQEYMTKEQDAFIKEIFTKYSKVPFEKIFMAEGISEIISELKGTIYYEPLKNIENAGCDNLFDYEMALDMFYFRYIWRKRKLYFTGSELKAMTDSVGTEADVLNLLWIYRAKKYYGMTTGEIASFIIPVYHKIKKDDIKKLLDMSDIKELMGAIAESAYGKSFTPETFKDMEAEKVSARLISGVYDKYYRLEPYSMAVMSSYLRDKMDEMSRLVKIVECIRYGYPKEKIINQIL